MSEHSFGDNLRYLLRNRDELRKYGEGFIAVDDDSVLFFAPQHYEQENDPIRYAAQELHDLLAAYDDSQDIAIGYLGSEANVLPVTDVESLGYKLDAGNTRGRDIFEQFLRQGEE